MSKRSIILIVIFLTVIAAMGIGTASAQDETTCLALAAAAINQTSTQCAAVGDNTICFGNPEIISSFHEETSPGVFESVTEQDFFLKPGDRADLITTEHIQTGPVDVSSDPDTWGMAFMNVQASLPKEVIDHQGGKGVVYVLLGGVEIENGVEPQDALVLPDEGAPVTTIAAADMRSAPTAHDVANSTNVISRLPAAATVNAYAVSQDGDWVRVVFQNQPGWISRATLGTDADVSELPQIGPDTFTPMQSFYFRDGIRNGAPASCANFLPSLMVVQGPEEMPVFLRVHGVDLMLESTAIFRTMPLGDHLGDFFEVIPMAGLVTLFPNTRNEVLVPPGFVARIRLGEFTSLGIEGDADEKTMVGFVGPLRPITPDEANRFRILDRLPGNILHYIFHIPHHVHPSGIGNAIDQLLFDHPALLNAARRACERGRLPAGVCEILGF